MSVGPVVSAKPLAGLKVLELARILAESCGQPSFDDKALEIARSIMFPHVPKELSAREFQLLRYFIEHRGATLTREELLNEVWGYNAMPSTRTVDVHVAWLRQKIEPNPRHPQFILTVHGMGYKFAG